LVQGTTEVRIPPDLIAPRGPPAAAADLIVFPRNAVPMRLSDVRRGSGTLFAEADAQAQQCASNVKV
jgi:hypothetical protein